MSGLAHSLAVERLGQGLRNRGRSGHDHTTATDRASELNGSIGVIGRSEDDEFIERSGGFDRIISCGCSSIGKQKRDSTRG